MLDAKGGCGKPGRRAGSQGSPNTGDGRRPQAVHSTRYGPLRRRPPRESRSVTAAIYTCARGDVEAAVSQKAWTISRLRSLLVGQDVDEGHWKDPFPVGLPFDMPDLRREKRVVRPRAAGSRPDTGPGDTRPVLWWLWGKETVKA